MYTRRARVWQVESVVLSGRRAFIPCLMHFYFLIGHIPFRSLGLLAGRDMAIRASWIGLVY